MVANIANPTAPSQCADKPVTGWAACPDGSPRSLRVAFGESDAQLGAHVGVIFNTFSGKD